MSIHASAHVSPDAQLGSDVTVGPGAVIDAGCVIGDQCEIRPHAIITGKTVMGPRNQIGYGAVIGSEPQDLSFQGGNSRVVIGADNILREHVTIHRGTKPNTETVLGNNNFLMVGAHVAHNCQIGNRVILVNNVLLAGYVTVEDSAFLGGGSVVHQFTRIGRLSIMRGQTRVGKDVPPFCMAVDTNAVAGLNRVGLKRAGLTPALRRELMEAYSLLFKSGMNVSQALEKIDASFQSTEIKHLVSFIRNTKRGICRHYQATGAEEDSE